MTKPVVLVIENSVGVTGALKSVIFIANKLRPSFTFVFLISKKSTVRTFIEAHELAVIAELPMLELSKRMQAVFWYLPQVLLNSWRLRNVIKENKVQIIHNNDLYNLLPVVLKLMGSSIPYVCHVRFLPDKFPKLLYALWVNLHKRFASKIICVSQKVFSSMDASDKYVVIYDAIDIREYMELKETKTKDFKHFLYLSNYIDGKGQQYALEAFYRIHKDIPDWKLQFVGSDLGLERNRHFKLILQQFAFERQFEDKIEWKEFTEDVQSEYRNADIVLNFSESESFSITCLEALCMGKPLIATDCGGPGEIINHMETGILVANKNVDEMSQAMRQLSDSGELRAKFSANAKKLTPKKFDLNVSAMKLNEIYSVMMTAR
jgi:L-malate glycosyltransferase